MPLKVICFGVNGFEIGSELERLGSEWGEIVWATPSMRLSLNLDSWD